MINALQYSPKNNPLAQKRISESFGERKEDEAFESQKLKNKNNKEIRKRVIKIAALVILCGFIGLRGAPKKLRSKLDQANKNIIDANIGEGKKGGIMFYAREGLKRIMNYSKATFNLAPLKDVVIAKVMNKNKSTANLANKITKWFEKVSVRSLRHSYSKTYEKLETAFASFADANLKIPKEDAEIINAKIAKIRETYAKGFSETARKDRLTRINREFDGLDPTGQHIVDDSLMEKFWKESYLNFNKFMKEKAYKSFLSEELALKTKIKYAEETGKYKYIIANSLTNMSEDCFDLLKHIDAFIEPNDQGTRNTIKKIANQLNKYKKEISTTNGDGREILLDKEFREHFVQLDKQFKESKKYKKPIVEEVSKEIETIINRLDNHKRGEINEILTIYKQHFGTNSEFMKILKTAYKAADSLEKSVDLETDKMFDKVRDLKIGSAPKDVLALLIPLGGVGYAMAKAKTTDERTSVTIKYGIPIIGAVAITMYCTIGLVSAGPSLLIGLLSGLAMNQIGSGINDSIKRFKAKKAKTAEQN